jgi:precorrin-6A synthase
MVIGIGAGDPSDVTVRAVEALRRTDVFFLLDKGDGKRELREARTEILRRHAGDRPYRVVRAQDVARDLSRGEYASAVADWHRLRADLCERMIRDELSDGGTGAFLVWGDPTLYDSTLAVLAEVRDRGVEFDLEVIAGISSASALVARHRVAVNRVGMPVRYTTGRRLARDWNTHPEDMVVMLDGHTTFTELDAPDAEIYWGAYLGMPQEILISGRLSEVAERIVTVRAEARERHGWLMDTYLLRRPAEAPITDPTESDSARRAAADTPSDSPAEYTYSRDSIRSTDDK